MMFAQVGALLYGRELIGLAVPAGRRIGVAAVPDDAGPADPRRR